MTATMLERAERALKNQGVYTPERASRLAHYAAGAEKPRHYLGAAAYRAAIDAWRSDCRAKAAEERRIESERAATLAAEQDRAQRAAVAAEAYRLCREVPAQRQNVQAFMAVCIDGEDYAVFCRRTRTKRDAAYQRVRRGAIALETHASAEVVTWVRERARTWKR